MDAKEIQEEEDFYSQFYPHLIRYQHQDQAQVQKMCVCARACGRWLSTRLHTVVCVQEHTLSRTYDPTEMSEMTERSINDQVCRHFVVTR